MLTDLRPQVVFNNNCIQIEVDEQASFIYVEWLRHPGSQEFRRLYQKAADISFAYNCQYWLSDARAIHYLEIGDQNWLLREMAPRLTTTSLLKYARLMKEESLAMMYIQRICENLHTSPYLELSRTQIQFFEDKKSALQWLFPEEERHADQQQALEKE